MQNRKHCRIHVERSVCVAAGTRMDSNRRVLMFSVQRCRSALCRLSIRVFCQASYSIMTRCLPLQRHLVFMQQDVITIDV